MMYLYAVYDRLSAEYSAPFAAQNDMVAARICLGICPTFNKAFGSLERIAIYAPGSAEIEPCEHTNVNDAVDQLLEMIKAHQPEKGDDQE